MGGGVFYPFFDFFFSGVLGVLHLYEREEGIAD